MGGFQTNQAFPYGIRGGGNPHPSPLLLRAKPANRVCPRYSVLNSQRWMRRNSALGFPLFPSFQSLPTFPRGKIKLGKEDTPNITTSWKAALRSLLHPVTTPKAVRPKHGWNNLCCDPRLESHPRPTSFQPLGKL